MNTQRDRIDSSDQRVRANSYASPYGEAPPARADGLDLYPHVRNRQRHVREARVIRTISAVALSIFSTLTIFSFFMMVLAPSHHSDNSSGNHSFARSNWRVVAIISTVLSFLSGMLLLFAVRSERRFVGDHFEQL